LAFGQHQHSSFDQFLASHNSKGPGNPLNIPFECSLSSFHLLSYPASIEKIPILSTDLARSNPPTVFNMTGLNAKDKTPVVTEDGVMIVEESPSEQEGENKTLASANSNAAVEIEYGTLGWFGAGCGMSPLSVLRERIALDNVHALSAANNPRSRDLSMLRVALALLLVL
jgi:hypothetical protein